LGGDRPHPLNQPKEVFKKWCSHYDHETILRKKITTGDYSPEIPLPSEDTLAEKYEVSRITGQDPSTQEGHPQSLCSHKQR
jgi:hypothetical protein